MKLWKLLTVVACAVALSACLAACGGGASGGGSSMGGSGAATKDSAEASASAESSGSVDDYSWEELSKISQEIGKADSEDAAIDIAKKYGLCTADGRLDGTQVKNVALSDGTTAQVQIAGFAHDDKSDGSGKAGITFIFKDAVTEHPMVDTPKDKKHSNSGGWAASEMRSWLNSSFKGRLPQDLQEVIEPVDKLTNNVGKTQDVSSVTATSDELWLFSIRELCGQVDWVKFGYFDSKESDALFNAEGEEYKLFRDANVVVGSDGYIENDILKKAFRGKDCEWWERTPYPDNSSSFLYASGGVPHYLGNDHVEHSLAVVPGFCV